MWWTLFLGACTGEAPPPVDGVSSSDVTVCRSGQEPSEGTCVPAGCGNDRWAGATDGVYVLAGGGGDGSSSAPFGTLAEALASGASVVNLGAPFDGAVYDEPIALDHTMDGVVVVGRCPALVHLTGVGDEAGIETSGSSQDAWSVAGITVDGPQGFGVSVRVGTLSLADVVVEGATGVGVALWTGRLDVQGVEVRGTLPDAEGLDGQGVRVFAGTLAGSALAVRGAVGQGVQVDAVAALDLDDLVVEDIVAGEAAGFGLVVVGGGSVSVRGGEVSRTDAMGVVVGGKESPADVQLTGFTVRDAHLTGVYAYGAGTTLTYTGEVSGTQPYGRGELGVGVAADLGATLTLDGFVHDNQGPGVAAIGAGTVVAVTGEVAGNTLVGAYALDGGTLDLEDAEIHGTVVDGDQGGYGVIVEQGATGTLRGGRVGDNYGSGLWVGVAGDGPATLSVYDTLVEDTLPATSSMGFGASVADGGVLVVDGAIFAGNHQGGIVATGAADVSLRGVTITDTTKDLGSEFEVAVGLGCQDGATLTADGVVVERTEGAGVAVVSGCSATLLDPVVADNTYAGIVIGSGSLTVTGGEVRGTRADAGKGGGFGVIGQRDTTVPQLRLTGVELSDNEAGGVVLLDGGAWELVNVVVAGAEPQARGDVHLFGFVLLAFGTAPWDGAVGLRLDGVTLTDAGGTAVLLDGGSATLSAVSWGDVGTAYPDDPALVQQACDDSTLRLDPGDAPSARICAGADVVTGDVSRFVGEFGEAEVVEP